MPLLELSTVHIPVHILERILRSARLTTQQDHDGVGLGRNEPQYEDVTHAARVTL